ncbi:unnamed protein product [Didymodactylos carnosus]|uniref:C2H2-type domain-containing protein n=1 Tax=Didymodactylos carnosus TaxID=1234261 RepID=A0A813X7J6_9BILA|nr:unnamed protein product [Didymodactylos carnosus]CAF0871805.1 unnamed protein product [Didymodactylos carnosus]CAF3554077.1 unnamed protein product [Didymodactylos carnosus]CAF3659092.1 unnamed protein product [Didymodactylos carnosus]
MELEEIKSNIANFIQQTKTHNLGLLMKWLEEVVVQYKGSGLQSILCESQKIGEFRLSNGQRFICSCGRVYSTDITIKELATPRLPCSSPINEVSTNIPSSYLPQRQSHNMSHNHHEVLDRPLVKRARFEQNQQTTPVVLTDSSLQIEKSHQTTSTSSMSSTSSSTSVSHFIARPSSTTNGNSSSSIDNNSSSFRTLMTNRISNVNQNASPNGAIINVRAMPSTHTQLTERDADMDSNDNLDSDIELSSDENNSNLDNSTTTTTTDPITSSYPLRIEALSKLTAAAAAAALASTKSNHNRLASISNDTNHSDSEYATKATINNFLYTNAVWSQNDVALKQIAKEPVSPPPLQPPMTTAANSTNREHIQLSTSRPMLIACEDTETYPRITYFKCTICHERFDDLTGGQEHVAGGDCQSPYHDTNGMDENMSQTSPQSSPYHDSSMDGMLGNTRFDVKASCPICGKLFSSVHTMIRHKTSIHDKQVRYCCNICGRFFYRKDKLTSHMVYHQDYDTYVCCFCTLGCKSRQLMRQHLKRDHMFSGEEARFNEILGRCQVKKALDLETNMSISYSEQTSTTTTITSSPAAATTTTTLSGQTVTTSSHLTPPEQHQDSQADTKADYTQSSNCKRLVFSFGLLLS